MATEIILLRLVHILSGIFWVGTALFTAFYLLPAMASAGPAAGPVMASFQRRKLYTVLPLMALLTMLSGARLMQIVSGGFQPAYFRSLSGRTFAGAAVAAIIAFIISLAVARPAALRAGALGAQLAETQDQAARATLMTQLEGARKKSAIGTLAAVALLVIAAGGMAIARYLG